MVLRVIDFQKLTAHYKNYREGVDEINLAKDKFLEKLEPLKREMNEILRYASSGLVVDEQSQERRAERFQQLQEEAINMDKNFKHEIKKMSDELNEKTYDELEVIIRKWAIDNNVDIISGKMEIIYNKEEFDITDKIIEKLKIKNLLHEEVV